jgi:DNA segregation ATPase FtsK/SpoIIIE-like protein
MAPRRNAVPQQHVETELAGVAIIAFAIFLGFSMASPGHHSGLISYLVRAPLIALFGQFAWGIPVAVGFTGFACFLEVTEAAHVWTLGVAFLCYEILLVTAYASGAIGLNLRQALDAIVGDLASPVLWLFTGMLTIAVSGISIKKLMGRTFLMLCNTEWPRLQSLRLELPPIEKPVRAPKASKKVRDKDHAPTVKGETPELTGIVQPPPFATDENDDSDDDRGTYSSPRRDVPALPMTPVSPGRGQASAANDSAGAVFTAPPRTDASTRNIPTITNDLMWEIEDAEVDEYIVGDGSTEAPKKRAYRLPPFTLFDEPITQLADDTSREEKLRSTLESFGVGVDVVNKERGPSITRYELKPHKGVKISRITALADDLALALAAVSVRIEAPIPGRSAVGIEVPNAVVSVVAIREILEMLPMHGMSNTLALPMALGKDITGQAVYGDLARMPHLLVAGATGAGKSVCLNNIIASLLTCKTPDEVQMLFIDPKRVELTVYNGIPHLVKEVITDARLAAGALFEMTKEMDSRYERFAKASVRKIEEYNAKFPEETLPYVVIIIDELADLMLVAPAKVETTICRIAQLARATGIHLIVATQRPSVDVITGIIKANIPSRIAFAVSSQIDSRTILDMGGAERLLGRGDMLYLPIDAPKPRRAQGAFITNEEVTRLVEFWAAQARPKNLLEVDVMPIDDEVEEGKGLDPLSFEAAEFIIQTNYASTAQLQSQFQIGHPRAVRLMKGLEEMKVVGPHEGTKPRKILIGLGDLDLMSHRFGKKDEPYANGHMPDELGG